MNTTFIGIDLAWKSERNPSGVAVLKGDREGAELEALETFYSKADVLEFVRSHASANTVVAIDAPLIILNETGQRACETAVGKRYGNRDASCHTSNMILFPDAASVALAAALVADGFVHPEGPEMNPAGRIVLEVYPHAAMVALFNLKKTIKYKKGPLAIRRAGLCEVRKLMNELAHAQPALMPTEPSGGSSLTVKEGSNGGHKPSFTVWLLPRTMTTKIILIPCFCAYLALYFRRWSWDRNELFGTVDVGYILNPQLVCRSADPG